MRFNDLKDLNDLNYRSGTVRQLVLESKCSRLHPVLEMEFIENVFQMVLDRVFCDSQFVADLFVGPTFGKKLDHLPLLGGELLLRRLFRGSVSLRGKLI